MPFGDVAPVLETFGFRDLLVFSEDVRALKETRADLFEHGACPFALYACADIRAPDAGKLPGKISAARAVADFVAVRSADEKVMRAAVESSSVDILIPSERGKVGAINHIVAKAAADNNVAFAFETAPLINSRGYRRAKLIAGYSEMVPVLRRYGVPVLLLSGAESGYDLRDPLTQRAFGELFTLEPSECRAACAENFQNMLRRAEMTKSENYVMKGVEIVRPREE